MRLSLSRLGMTWGRIGQQRGKVEYTLSAYEQNPYAGVFGDVSYRYYSRLFKTLFTIWVPNILLGYGVFTWANWEYTRCQRKLPSQFADEKPPENEAHDFYQLTNSTTDFKSRSSDVFDKLANLEKQHDVQKKTQNPICIIDDETPSTSQQNPIIPSNAITFKKRPADDSFTRPMDKWKKYDLDDVNEHHLGGMGNQHALNDFLRTRVKPSITKETKKEDEEEDNQAIPIFRRPAKKPILANEDEEDNRFIPIRAPLPPTTTEPKIENDDNEEVAYKLKSIRKKPRGVALSTNDKKSIKTPIENSEEKDATPLDDNEEEDIDDELFEP
ncbi:unnamed protein product [Adineta steineri]|uniref:Cytochrome b-c1 complex subunit 8 n=1 Tax=Adineta steineri TaxID=433720 RepID=A0A814SP71_9BILA|nr:unnamed protein product [Adineta steineri]CAF1261325.1 unnamed protein product [Adineta steineri]